MQGGGGRFFSDELRGKAAAYVRTLGILLALVLLSGYFAWTEESFRTWYNVQTMARQMVVVSLAAVGMTMVIISKGIDLSVGSVIALSMVVTAWVIEQGYPIFSAVLAGVLTGVLCGFVNGVLITGFRIVAFIVTLGMMGMARGAAKLVASSETIPVNLDGSWLRTLTMNPGASSLPAWVLFAPAVWVLIVLAVVMSLVLRRSVFGRHVYAVGSNESAARLCGVHVTRVKIMIYSVAGLFTGLAGVSFCSRQTLGDPTGAGGLELDVIAAVVIGGGSLNGGEGSILGSLVGAAIMQVLRTGLLMRDVAAPWQEVLIGLIIIVAVAMDQLQHARSD